MGSIRSAFKTDADAERDGIEIEVTGDDGDTMSFFVTRAGPNNKAFRAAMEKETRTYRQSNMDLDRLPIEITNKINAKVYARVIMRGWKNVTDDDGNEIPFSHDEAEKLFLELPDLLHFIMREAGNFSNFREALRKEQAKN